MLKQENRFYRLLLLSSAVERFADKKLENQELFFLCSLMNGVFQHAAFIKMETFIKRAGLIILR